MRPDCKTKPKIATNSTDSQLQRDSKPDCCILESMHDAAIFQQQEHPKK
jgi:hypothetical protein